MDDEQEYDDENGDMDSITPYGWGASHSKDDPGIVFIYMVFGERSSVNLRVGPTDALLFARSIIAAANAAMEG